MIRAIVELSELPLGIDKTDSIRRAMHVYGHAIASIRDIPSPSTAKGDQLFTEVLRIAKDNGANLLPLICGGLKELGKTDMGKHMLTIPSVQDDLTQRLDTFFLARIGIRMLIGQHVESVDCLGGRVEHVNVEETVRSACARASQLCELYLGVAPTVEIRVTTNVSAPFTYVGSHLHHMVFELVKNAMRATVDFHANLQHKQPGKVNKHTQVMNPDSRLLGFILPNVSPLFTVG